VLAVIEVDDTTDIAVVGDEALAKKTPSFDADVI
jgi:hypothetical protein